MTGTDYLRCVVERTTYQSSETGFAVLQCRAKGYPELVTVVGNMPEVHSGSVLSLEGAWKMDARYGRQFSVIKFEETLPATVYGIEKYLGSGLIKGIGPKFAHLIVNAFGKDTLEVIEQEPDKLLQVRGLGKLRVERIKKSWETQKEIKNIMLFLQSHDISTAHATRIYKKYEKDSLRVVKENPYRLADDIWGIGFKTADAIAAKLGFGHDRYERLRAGLLYTLNQLSDEGHCFATANQLIKTGATLLEVDEDLLKPTLRRMIAEEDVIVEQEKRTGQGEELPIYLPAFYHAEIGVAKMLRGYRNPPRESSQAQREMIARIEQEIGIEYDSVQRDAILAAINNDILILTGGPGTGKTTTTLGIISALAEAGKEVLLAAPTGRAAKRLSETTEMDAKTIHRLLEFNPQEGFQRNEDNPLEGDVLIVDLFLCFVLVLVISIVLVGCGSNTSSENAGTSDTGKADSQAWNDPSKPEDQTWGDPENYESQSWSDPENYDDQEWRDTENPGTEAAAPGESDHAGMYRHEIDGIVFYTEHDVERWIGHQDGLGMTFDLEQMVKDIFGDENTLKANEATIIPLKDYEAAFMFNGSVEYLALYNRNLNGQTRMQAQEGFIPAIGVESTDIFDLGDGSAEYYKPYYFINGSYYCTEYEMIEIILCWLSSELSFTSEVP